MRLLASAKTRSLSAPALMFDYMVFAQGEYTKQIGYLQPLTKPNAVRVDLEGGPTGDITENQGKNAIERLAQLAARNKHQDGGKQ